jgi:hypothetical protein
MIILENIFFGLEIRIFGGLGLGTKEEKLVFFWVTEFLPGWKLTLPKAQSLFRKSPVMFGLARTNTPRFSG